jgi:hypothetical protein
MHNDPIKEIPCLIIKVWPGRMARLAVWILQGMILSCCSHQNYLTILILTIDAGVVQ